MGIGPCFVGEGINDRMDPLPDVDIKDGLKRICNETKAMNNYKEGRDPVFKSSVSQLSDARPRTRLGHQSASTHGAHCSLGL